MQHATISYYSVLLCVDWLVHPSDSVDPEAHTLRMWDKKLKELHRKMYVYKHTHIHTYIHTYIHTCIHTYIHTLNIYPRKYFCSQLASVSLQFFNALVITLNYIVS